MAVICPKCQRSVEPIEKIEADKKGKKYWLITTCPFERCQFNIDIEPTTVKLWNDSLQKFY